jgi:hypothetical protein
MREGEDPFLRNAMTWQFACPPRSKHRRPMAKRRADDGDDERPARRQRGESNGVDNAPGEEASVGQRTSHIRNKQRRSEVYHQLKHKQAVRLALARTVAQHSTWAGVSEQHRRGRSGTASTRSVQLGT